jgi:hypothetical protein
MKNHYKIYCLAILALLLSTTKSVAQQANSKVSLLESKGIMSFRPMDIMKNPYLLQKVWIDQPIPTTFYTSEEKEVQQTIHEKTEDGIITYAPLNEKRQWTEIDKEDITPYTWKWIDLELVKPDGSMSKIHLRRPHWWLKDRGADSIGKKIYLDIPEMGIVGWATTKAIRLNQLDTRFWKENRKGDYVTRPITGKFEHESNNVYQLFFGNNATPLGVTGNHPIWSVDRQDWIEAVELNIGEKVKTYAGVSTLKTRKKIEGTHKVYNLEVYRNHNFMVSEDAILVHNNCTVNSLLKKTSAEPDKKVSAQLKAMGRGIEGIRNNPGLRGIPGLDGETMANMTPREITTHLVDLVNKGKITEKEATGFMGSFQKAFRGDDPNKNKKK